MHFMRSGWAIRSVAKSSSMHLFTLRSIPTCLLVFRAALPAQYDVPERARGNRPNCDAIGEQ
jgi:hypothetical protein